MNKRNWLHIHWWFRFQLHTPGKTYTLRECRCGAVQFREDSRWQELHACDLRPWVLADLGRAVFVREHPGNRRAALHLIGRGVALANRSW